jgi:hypothetical protein
MRESSIFSSTAHQVTCWPSATGTPSQTSAAVVQTPRLIASSHDARLIAIIEAPIGAFECANVGFARKERELRAAFAALPILDQRALHARLSNPRTGDLLSEKFHCMTCERRTRLLAFLGDARRRAALAAWSR